MDRAFQRCRPLMLRGTFYSVPPRYKLEKQLRKEEKNKKIIVSPMALTNLKETAENICNP